MNQLDLEVSIKAQDFVEQGYCGQEAYDMAAEFIDNEKEEKNGN